MQFGECALTKTGGDHGTVKLSTPAVKLSPCRRECDNYCVMLLFYDKARGKLTSFVQLSPLSHSDGGKRKDTCGPQVRARARWVGDRLTPALPTW